MFLIIFARKDIMFESDKQIFFKKNVMIGQLFFFGEEEQGTGCRSIIENLRDVMPNGGWSAVIARKLLNKLSKQEK
jgi:hypothetical protein